MDEENVVQHLFHIRDEVGGQNDAGLRVIVPDDSLQNVVSRGGVHPTDGLIQQVEPGRPAHDQDELHLLPRALAELLHPPLLRDLQPGEHLPGRVLPEVRIEVPVEVQQLARRHPLGQAVPVRQVGDQAVAPFAGGLPVDEYLTGRGGQQPVYQLDESGLTAAVGAQQAHNAARFHCEAYVRQRVHAAEALAQVLAFQNRHFLTPPSPAPDAGCPEAPHFQSPAPACPGGRPRSGPPPAAASANSPA